MRSNLGFQSRALPSFRTLRTPVASNETDGSQAAHGNLGNDRPLTMFEIEQTVPRLRSVMSRAIASLRPAVLVVEDEPLTRLSAMEMVEAAGCEAIGAFNADEAVRVLEARADIRAVFTDLQMPGSMDGLALMRLTKKRWPSVVGLVTSGRTNVTPGDLPCGVRFLNKPYSLLQIETALRELFV
jgi:CheY-like chemotaxis protein